MNVLIVNNYTISDPNPVGYTMETMLLGIPNVKYLQYCIDYRGYKHTQVTECLFNNVSDSIAYVIKVLGIKIKELLSGKNGKTAEETSEEKVTLPTGQSTNALGEFMRGVFYSMPCRVSKKNMRRIREFKPDVIYTMAENIRVINQAIKLSKKLNIPIVYHGMDDYKATAYMSNGLTRIFHRHLEARFKKMHEYTVENLGICEGMAEYYGKLYGKPYSYAGNCIFDFNDEPYEPDGDKPMKILYSGSLHFHRGELVLNTAKVVDELNSEGYKIKLEVYAPKNSILFYKDEAEKYNHSKWAIYGYPQIDKMETFSAADVFLHTNSFEEADRKFMKYSFSTKLPEYFAIGRGVIAYGPKDIADIKYMKDNDCGWVVETEEEMKQLLKMLYENPEERIRSGKKSNKIAHEIFSHEAMQNKIFATLDKSVREWKQK